MIMRNQSPARLRGGLGMGFFARPLCLDLPNPDPSRKREGGQ